MGQELVFDSSTVDRTIIGLIVLGVLVAVLRGGRVVNVDGIDFTFQTAIPAFIGTFLYLRYSSIDKWAVAGLFLWGCVSLVVASFVGFFVVMDNPAAVPSEVTSTYLLIGAVSRFAAATASVCLVFGAASVLNRSAVLIATPVVAFGLLTATVMLL